MNKPFFLVASILLATFFTSCEDKSLDDPSSVSVSQGTYMGIVHLNWDPVPDAQYYNIERQGPDGNWLGAGTVSTPPFDDHGLTLPDNRITFGTHYSYRISSASSSYDDSPFREVAGEGWTYVLQPISLTVSNENGEIKLSWTDTNANVQNVQELWYQIQQKATNSDTYLTIHTTDHLNKGESENTYSFTSNLESDLTASYKIYATYNYTFKNMDQEGAGGQCHNESNEEAVSGGSGTSSYTWNSLGDFGTSTNGISFVRTKVYDNTLYTAILDNPEIGSPVLYKLNGSSLNDISASYPADLQNNFGNIDFTVKSGTEYIAGISDSTYIYSYNGEWSNNLVSNNFGYTNKPQALAIETDEQDVFVAIYTNNNDLDIKSWDHDTIWDDNASITNSDAISNIEMIQLNGLVYLYYLKSNSAYNSTLYIKHYNGSSWVDDLEWTRDNLMDIKLYADGSSNLYFVSNSQQFAEWTGSVFKVTSSTNAEDLITGNEDWKAFPSDISVNSDGDIMIVYTHIVSATQVNPELAVYKNNTWSKVSGDYTNGAFPSSINHINQDFFFIYGDAQNLTQYGQPLKLKAEKLTEN